ncbi:alpha/beta hydrolase [Aspergillus fischeri NRRL 181]|uniref:Alpha/beta fold family hydrolase, putative n=1 Tax=Neosartorya fischeri (strain ATCC 1020 / DSM 3700 / CBS 544.65 / FGSC A1164 / JCM 1740 / NRRL 181 / WB 181) TaxID=331117 RepID=A1CUZ0_NEOFI|nr:alpha/beta fold family hydrolase, putative [Aspergillus fischeri NRRL 181]EAW25567.1 alpha/beta fold family hydrolase, putative [Aspergillus fischeri NRRL 181]
MGHGIGCIKDAGLAPFVTTFAHHGYIAVTFDYLYFGQSEGEPRNLMSVSQQLHDFEDVISWVRTQPERFDVDKIVVWGTSFGGMHTTALLAQDHKLAGGIAQCPCVDGLAASLQVPFLQSMRLTWAALRDVGHSIFGLGPVYVNLSSNGLPGSPLAIMSGEEVAQGWDRLVSMEDMPFPNKIAARSLFSVLTNRPVHKAHKIRKPYLIILPTWDGQAPLSAAEKTAALAPLGEGLRVQGGHFDLYYSGPAFDENIRGQLEFLERILKK